MKYDLIDKELKTFYVTLPKYMFLVNSFISLVFGIFLLFNKSTGNILFLVIFAITAFIFLMGWTVNKKKYGKKIGINDNELIIYDYKNNRIQVFKVSEVKRTFIDIVFQEYHAYIHRKCMIIYIDFEPYEGMEYRSYWNMTNVQIIQNNELIEILNSILINK